MRLCSLSFPSCRMGIISILWFSKSSEMAQAKPRPVLPAVSADHHGQDTVGSWCQRLISPLPPGPSCPPPAPPLSLPFGSSKTARVPWVLVVSSGTASDHFSFPLPEVTVTLFPGVWKHCVMFSLPYLVLSGKPGCDN